MSLDIHNTVESSITRTYIFLLISPYWSNITRSTRTQDYDVRTTLMTLPWLSHDIFRQTTSWTGQYTQAKMVTSSDFSLFVLRGRGRPYYISAVPGWVWSRVILGSGNGLIGRRNRLNCAQQLVNCGRKQVNCARKRIICARKLHWMLRIVDWQAGESNFTC